MRQRPTMFDPEMRQGLVTRLRSLEPARPARWGRMNAPQMITHLTDQMCHALGLTPVEAKPGLLRWWWVRWASIYLVPWPKGRIQGPPEAFVTQPAAWEADLARLVDLVEQFGRRSPEEPWADHALFGPMKGRDWGVFAVKHFDHHLRQFGV